MSEAPSMQAERSMRLFSWRGLLGLGCGLGLVLFWGLVALRIATDSGNHIGVNLLWILPLALVAVLAGALWRAAQFRRTGMALLVLGLLTVVGVVLLDRLNVLVEYEAWLDRGMPERPF